MLMMGGLILGLVVPSASAETLDCWGGPSNSSTGSVGGYLGTAPAVAPLDAAAKAARNEAISEEYGALSLYNSLMTQFGNVLPFSRIARAEAQHVRALSQLFTKYDLPAPANPGPDLRWPDGNLPGGRGRQDRQRRPLWRAAQGDRQPGCGAGLQEPTSRLAEQSPVGARGVKLS
jgi:hypothetical protein